MQSKQPAKPRQTEAIDITWWKYLAVKVKENVKSRNKYKSSFEGLLGLLGLKLYYETLGSWALTHRTPALRVGYSEHYAKFETSSFAIIAPVIAHTRLFL